MKYFKGLCIFGLSFGVVFCAACFANAQVSFVSNPLWLSSSHVTEGTTVQASTVITKQSTESISGTITFYSNGKSIGTSDFSLPASVGGVVVAISFVPEKGSHLISAKVTRAASGQQNLNVAEEVKAKETLTVDPDNDRDGIADAADPDDDNDGISDIDEKTKGTDPLKKEVSDGSASSSGSGQVAGVSTTSVSGIIEQAKSIAGPVGETVFETTEGWRESGKKYFDGKVAGNSSEFNFSSTTNSDLLKNPMGIWEMVKSYAYKAGSFIFGNLYAFYIFFILLILWIVRKIWRRYSLD